MVQGNLYQPFLHRHPLPIIPNFAIAKFAPKGLHDKILIGFCRLVPRNAKGISGINPGDLLGRAGQGNPGFFAAQFCAAAKFGIPRKAGQTRCEFVLAAFRYCSRRIFLSKNPG